MKGVELPLIENFDSYEKYSPICGKHALIEGVEIFQIW